LEEIKGGLREADFLELLFCGNVGRFIVRQPTNSGNGGSTEITLLRIHGPKEGLKSKKDAAPTNPAPGKVSIEAHIILLPQIHRT
jgi:hypothetical protein